MPPDQANAPSAAQAIVRLPALSGTDSASSLRDDIASLIANGALHVNAADVERISTACIQILLAADQKLARIGRGISIEGITTPLEAAFDDLGLSGELRRWTSTADVGSHV